MPATRDVSEALALARELGIAGRLSPQRLALMIVNKTPGEAMAEVAASFYVMGYADGQGPDAARCLANLRPFEAG